MPVLQCSDLLFAIFMYFPELNFSVQQLHYTEPVVLYKCETWYLTLREEQRFGVFECRGLKRICGPEWKKQEVGEIYISRSYIIFTPRRLLLRWSNQGYVTRMD
jgi:hypothetical protein